MAYPLPPNPSGPFAYLPGIPTASERLRDSQPQIQANFASIMSVLDANHVDFLDPNNAGFHNFLSMVPQSNLVANQPVAPTGGMVIYNAIPNKVADVNFPVTVPTSELNLIRFGSVAIVPFTASILSVNATPGNVSSGWTYLPSGILMQWGSTSGGALAGNAWTLITFPMAFPNACFSISVSPKVITPQPSNAQTTTLIDLNSTWTAANFYVFNRRTDAGFGYASDCTWFAIGN